MAEGGMSAQQILEKWNGATLKNVFTEYEGLNPLGWRGTTRPWKSTQTFTGTVLNALGAPVMAHAVFRAGQAVEWFGYGINDVIQRGGIGLTKVASAADTNLARGRKTNGVTDFVIQGISSSVNGIRVQHAAADIPAGAADPDVLAAYNGNAKVYDPGALIVPPTFGSPLNLEEVIMNALAPQIEFTLAWDRSRIIPVGTIDQIPEGAAKSLLRANGLPETGNRYKAFEGYPWRRTDKPDGDFVVQGFLRDRVVIPFPLIAFAGAAAPLVVPQNVMIDISVRVHGQGLEQISQT